MGPWSATGTFKSKLVGFNRVEGLRANGPGDKAKVLGMQEGQGDFITKTTASTCSTAARRDSRRMRSGGG
jgi:hypothetical protein